MVSDKNSFIDLKFEKKDVRQNYNVKGSTGAVKSKKYI